jgi:hypothetical protein
LLRDSDKNPSFFFRTLFRRLWGGNCDGDVEEEEAAAAAALAVEDFA